MLIVQLEPPHRTRGGDWFYRTSSPAEAMARLDGVHVVDATNVHPLREQFFRHADVVVLNMVCDADLLPLIAERRARGQVTVYELNDDVASMQPWNPAAAFFADAGNQLLFRALLRACDGVQYCTDELERRYRRFGSRGAVFPNQMSRPPPGRPPKPEGRLVIGWGGSHGHLADMARIAPLLSDWINRRDDVELRIMASEPIWRLFDLVRAGKRTRVLPGSIDDYYAFLSQLDVGLAPLEDTGFNRCRSDVKFLEYGLHGVVAVVQDLAPYRTVRDGGTGFLFRTEDELLVRLDRLAEQPDKRSAVATAAVAYVVSERSEAAHAQERLRFYEELPLAPAARAAAPLPGPQASLLEALAKTDAVERSGRHWTSSATRFEVCLHDALVLGQSGRRGEALSLLAEASRLVPEAYQPYLFGAPFADHPEPLLSQALTRNPRSIHAALLLADALDRAGDFAGAVASLTRAAEMEPGYHAPYARLSTLLARRKQDEEAKSFRDIADRLRGPLLDSGDCS